MHCCAEAQLSSARNQGVHCHVTQSVLSCLVQVVAVRPSSRVRCSASAHAWTSSASSTSTSQVRDRTVCSAPQRPPYVGGTSCKLHVSKRLWHAMYISCVVRRPRQERVCCLNSRQGSSPGGCSCTRCQHLLTLLQQQLQLWAWDVAALVAPLIVISP